MRRIIPEGDVTCSPGLPSSATLGFEWSALPNPEGVAAAYVGRNPFRVHPALLRVPRVAEYRNPGCKTNPLRGMCPVQARVGAGFMVRLDFVDVTMSSRTRRR